MKGTVEVVEIEPQVRKVWDPFDAHQAEYQTKRPDDQKLVKTTIEIDWSDLSTDEDLFFFVADNYVRDVTLRRFCTALSSGYRAGFAAVEQSRDFCSTWTRAVSQAFCAQSASVKPTTPQTRPSNQVRNCEAASDLAATVTAHNRHPARAPRYGAWYFSDCERLLTADACACL